MNRVEIKFSDEWGSTVVIKEFEECHISHYVEAYVSALLAEGFQRNSIERYIPVFDVGAENDVTYRALRELFDEGD